MIELVVYLAVVVIIMLAVINFGFTFIVQEKKAQLRTEVNASGQYILNKIDFEVKRANGIDGTSVLGINPSVLVINTDGGDIVFDTFVKSLTLNNRTINITKLRMQRGSAPAVDITGDQIDVTNFTVENINGMSADTLNIDLQINSLNPDNDPKYEAVDSWNTTVTIK